MMILTYS